MREILFRGKRIDNGEWVFGNHLYDNITDKHFIVPFGNITESQKTNEEGCCYCVGFEVIPKTVGQYTGLTDKNGKKIFEGDIHEWHNVGGVVNIAVLKYGTFNEFEYDHNSYGWYFETPDGRQYCLEGNESEYVIITGSIHDNPELLEGLK